MEALLTLFPREMREMLAAALNDDSKITEEIRCRIGHPVTVLKKGRMEQLSKLEVTAEVLDYLFERATSASVHAYAEEIQNGFLFTSSRRWQLTFVIESYSALRIDNLLSIVCTRCTIRFAA